MDTGTIRYSSSSNPQSNLNSTRANKVSESKGKSKVIGEGPQCYKCRGYGHFAAVCPIKEQGVGFIGEQDPAEIGEGETRADDLKQNLDIVEDEEEHLQVADLPLCVIHRVLTGQQHIEKQASHDWRRTNIFHTRVNYGNRSLNVIIDNENGMNVVSKELVDRLQIKQEIHPTPYKVS